MNATMTVYIGGRKVRIPIKWDGKRGVPLDQLFPDVFVTAITSNGVIITINGKKTDNLQRAVFPRDRISVSRQSETEVFVFVPGQVHPKSFLVQFGSNIGTLIHLLIQRGLLPQIPEDEWGKKIQVYLANGKYQKQGKPLDQKLILVPDVKLFAQPTL